MVEIKLMPNGHPRKIVISGLAFEYYVRLLDIFGSDTKKPLQKDTNKTKPPIQTEKTELDIPIHMNDCAIGLSPLHIPSHGVLFVSKGIANAQITNPGDISLNLNLISSSFYIIDDIRGKIQENSTNPSLSSDTYYLGLKKQGYTCVAGIDNLSVEVMIPSETKTKSIVVDIEIEKIFLHSCADSTFSLIQLVNDLKPPLELPSFDDRFKIHVGGNVNTFQDVQDDYFSPNKIFSNSDAFDANADFVFDDVPTNLEFVESYYADKSSKPQWASSPSESLSTSYSNTDVLLEEDLNDIVARESANRNLQVVDYNEQSIRKMSAFEQKASTHDQTLSFTDDHFGMPALNLNNTDFQKVSKSTSNGKTENSLFSEAGIDLSSTVSQDLYDSKNNYQYCDKFPSLIANFSIDSAVWDLHDGFDWKYTRDVITNAVFQVEEEVGEVIKEKERAVHFETSDGNSASHNSQLNDDSQMAFTKDSQTGLESEEVIGEYLFNSIFIGMSTHQDASDLRLRINKDLQDLDDSDTTSQASRMNSPRLSQDKSRSHNRYSKNSSKNEGLTPLKLKRSKSRKLRIDLHEVTGSMSLFKSINDTHAEDSLRHSEYGGDKSMLLNSIVLKVKDVEILDNVQTSTWNKFLTYMRSAGDREAGANMISLEVENVKPVPNLPTAELIVGVQILPLRLHVDQDALDFVTRFFEFKDDRFDRFISHLPVDIPFVQKFDIKDVPVKLDYKPKKVDYAGLKSGHTTEFINFFILDEADMVLRHITLHGVLGFPRLGKMLNSIWMPDIRKNQLGDVLSGLAPVRSLVKIGSGIKDLVAVPIQEYKKDGRIVRSIQKGAWLFAKNTSNELVKFGAKLAVGTQTVLENAEQVMGGAGSSGRRDTSATKKKPLVNSLEHRRSKEYGNFNLDDDSPELTIEDSTIAEGLGSSSQISERSDSERQHIVSLYANQPKGIKQGFQSAYNSMGRNLSIARGAVVDIKSEAVKAGSVQVSLFLSLRFRNIILQ